MRRTSVGVDIAKLKFDVAVLLDNQKYKTKKYCQYPFWMPRVRGLVEPLWRLSYPHGGHRELQHGADHLSGRQQLPRQSDEPGVYQTANLLQLSR
ncbi:hypothetical protein [Serratia fonticola]|uniref:hypothetical protein n=1 Tax=Serratia fonticola TaxID=47917 RepID=UPI0012683232|nr:hypothetical protein [Serratia fonticola]CAI0978825.1 Uncharacterised protein [Serratia fonticola]